MTSRAAGHIATLDGHATQDRLAYGHFTSERTFELLPSEMTREAIVRFGRRYDPQPFHVDERAARATILKGLSASGWHTCIVFMKALQDGALQHCLEARLFAIDEIKWLFPVRLGDHIRGIIRARAIDAAGPWPGSGQIELDCVATTDKGRRVMTWKGRAAVGGYPGSQRYADSGGDASGGIPKSAGELAHFDDISVGDEVSLGSIRVTGDAIREFIDEYGLAGPELAKGKPEEANGWHLASLFMSQLVRYYLREAASLRRRELAVPGLGPSPGIRHLRWPVPVRAGDELTLRAWAVRKSEISPRSNWGILTGACAAVNQFGQNVLSFEGQLLLERRMQAASD